MNIDLSRFKVVYEDKVLNALSLLEFYHDFDECSSEDKCQKINLIKILVINKDGNIEELQDEAWKFQFIPNLSK